MLCINLRVLGPQVVQVWQAAQSYWPDVQVNSRIKTVNKIKVLQICAMRKVTE